MKIIIFEVRPAEDGVIDILFFPNILGISHKIVKCYSKRLFDFDPLDEEPLISIIKVFMHRCSDALEPGITLI